MMTPSSSRISACVTLPSGPGTRRSSVKPNALARNSSAASQSSYNRYGVMRGKPSGGFAGIAALLSRWNGIYARAHRPCPGGRAPDQPDCEPGPDDDGAEELERADRLDPDGGADQQRADRKEPREQPGSLDAEPPDGLVPGDDGERGQRQHHGRDGADARRDADRSEPGEERHRHERVRSLAGKRE